MKNFMSRITRLSRAGARQARKLSILAVMALLFFCPIHFQVLAAASDLDLTFGSGGKVTTDLFGSSDSLMRSQFRAMENSRGWRYF